MVQICLLMLSRLTSDQVTISSRSAQSFAESKPPTTMATKSNVVMLNDDDADSCYHERATRVVLMVNDDVDE